MGNGWAWAGEWEAKENLWPTHVGPNPHGHWFLQERLRTCLQNFPIQATDSWKRLLFSPVSPLRPGPTSVHKTLLLGLCREAWRSSQSKTEKKGMVKIFQLLSWKETSLRKINLPSYWGSWGLSGVWAPVSPIWWSVLFKAILYVRRGSQSNRFHGYLSH